MTSYGQDKNINTLLNSFDKFRNENYEEKVYLHLDRPSYLTGETMWFKVYLVNAAAHTPSALSTVVYIEILNQDKQPVLQSKVEIREGVGSGSLYIPATLNTSNYTVRAYTGWMKNYPADFYFHKIVPIVNPFVVPEISQKNAREKVSLQFFPEGGNLVTGIKSKVAFQILDSSGKGVNSEGVIMDENMDTVVTFKPSYVGIGSFYFKPEEGKTYKAYLQDKRAGSSTFALPIAKPVGYVLEVSELPNNGLSIAVRTNDQRPLPVYLFIHSRNRIFKASVSTTHDNGALFELDESEVPEGISHITIFDADMKPVCERLFFKQPTAPEATITTNQTSYLTRSNIKMNVDIVERSSNLPFNLSVSVYKLDSIPSTTLTIQQYLSLTSELKGTVESPAFYFQSTAAAKNAADNLMLTHGWRRFKWDHILEHKSENKKHIPETHGHIIQAIAKKADTLAIGVFGYLAAPGKIVRVYPARSDHDGKLYFEMLDFYGKSKVVLQKNVYDDSVSTLTIVSPFSDQYSEQALIPLELSSSWKEQLEGRSVAMQVEDIYKGNSMTVSPNHIDSMAFYAIPDATYLLDDFTRFPVLEEVLREYVPGVFVRKRKDGFHFIVVNKELNVAYRTSPLILLDGVPIFDEDEIMSFDPRLIKRLDVVQSRWLLGPMSFFGIVSFSTYNGDLGGFPLNTKSITLDYEGLQLQREFYSPSYEDKKQRESRLPDHRTALYWNPNLITDSDGKSEIEFYTSDLPGKYTVVVEGMNTDGQLCTLSTTFTVKDSN